MSSRYSIIEFFPDESQQNCGYCSGSDSSVSTGMWAHVLTVEDYQELINRNWRRSGCYCYHPQSDRTCCPPYMIRCDVNAFKLGKHHKKVIKRFNRYLMTGDTSAGEASSQGNGAANRSSSSASEPSITPSTSTTKEVARGVGADPSKPKAIKAKQLRLQRKLEKLEHQSGGQEVDPLPEPASGSPPGPASGPKGNMEKTLGDLLEEYNPLKAKHKFELRLVRSHPASEEFKASLKEEHTVYKKYQVAVHKDPESKPDMKQFTQFLVNSPLVEETRGGVELGSFHYQYILDGAIIAVEVMDILPQFISSKYLFYDPQYEFLTLGTYSALRSIYLIQQLHRRLASLEYYLMGFYIHTCQKMRYKMNFSASYLLCPETYQWVAGERCMSMLDANKCSRLCEDPSLDDADKPRPADHMTTFCLHQRQVVPYQVLLRRYGSADESEVKLYTRLVGTSLSRSILLYRS